MRKTDLREGVWLVCELCSTLNFTGEQMHEVALANGPLMVIFWRGRAPREGSDSTARLLPDATGPCMATIRELRQWEKVKVRWDSYSRWMGLYIESREIK